MRFLQESMELQGSHMVEHLAQKRNIRNKPVIVKSCSIPRCFLKKRLNYCLLQNLLQQNVQEAFPTGATHINGPPLVALISPEGQGLRIYVAVQAEKHPMKLGKTHIPAHPGFMNQIQSSTAWM